MKKLVIVSHPDIEKSVINKRWVEELKKYPEQFTVHNIYSMYPDGKIDIEKEQKLIEEHDTLILQYPLYWFNCPPLLKKWLDDTFTYGWAYGSKGNKMKGKKIALAISAGIREEDLQKDKEWKVTIEELILPFKTTTRYTKSDYRGHFVLHDTHNAPHSDALENSAQNYIHFLMNI
ncbi:NAD(P)H-dependent oxidoreductase [Dysgonomonas sp. ZJ279]|uniref:NAD(P)H-dependent oxidoreductase n=1 Tax=Dysgonomonas sp. ZJ279 TaxID=2709796 RepID=UPI0013EA72A5|nr:NAD(P)H-dependent oxidoreductase [Dysgonomonas sp. ZJ279]